MRLIKTLLVAGLLTTGLAACADYYDEGPGNGYDYNRGYDRGPDHDAYWRDGHRYCRSVSDPDDYYRCDPY